SKRSPICSRRLPPSLIACCSCALKPHEHPTPPPRPSCPPRNSTCCEIAVASSSPRSPPSATPTSPSLRSAGTSNTAVLRVGSPSPAATKSSNSSPKDGSLQNSSPSEINDESMETSTRCREGVPPQGSNHAPHGGTPRARSTPMLLDVPGRCGATTGSALE